MCLSIEKIVVTAIKDLLPLQIAHPGPGVLAYQSFPTTHAAL